MRAPVIGILTEGTAVTSFLPSLRESFRPQKLIEMQASQLADKALLQSLDLLVLPGVTSEDSPYQKYMTPSAVRSVRESVEGGMCLLLSCASVYHFSATKSYDSPHKTVEAAPGLGMLAGHSWGPVDGEHPIVDARDRFSDTRIAKVVFNDRAGRRIVTGVPYANGPAYVPALGEKIDVIARYMKVQGDAVAVGGKEVGLGYVAFEGVLPEMKLAHIPFDPSGALHPNIARLHAALSPHDAGRESLLDTLYDSLHRRMRNAKTPSAMAL